MKNFPHQIFLAVLLGILHAALAEFYTAMAEMEKLLQTEEEIVRTLDTYLKKEEERLEKVKWISQQYTNLQNAANENVDQFLSNPVNAYLLVKRLTTDWDAANELIADSESRDVIMSVTSQMLSFPSNEDLSGAAEALIRLQDIYLLNATAIANGEIKGSLQSAKLTAGDCFELGRQAFQGHDFNHSIVWMQEALRRMEQEDIKTAKKPLTLEYIAYSHFTMKNYEAAIEYTEEIIKLVPNHQRAPNNLKLYIQHKETAGKEKGDVGDETDFSTIDYEEMGLLDPKITAAYEKLCRGESLKTPNEQRKLHCYYSTNNNSYLLLQPVKVEVLNLDPRLVMYYDVLNDEEADILKSLAIPRLARATVSNSSTGDLEFANYRISKSSWLRDDDHPIIPRINTRVEYITGLSSETAEDLHVINYGIGGHYEPHFDHAKPEDKAAFMANEGNRIATWIFYLSHVPAGGSTVFPTIGVEVKPIKGAAAFWHNLRRSGAGDDGTRHAACPVLSGSKWGIYF